MVEEVNAHFEHLQPSFMGLANISEAAKPEAKVMRLFRKAVNAVKSVARRIIKRVRKIVERATKEVKKMAEFWDVHGARIIADLKKAVVPLCSF